MAEPTALAGLRILDLAGPIGVYATRLLAGLGADVIRIELRGDAVRSRPPFYQDVTGIERSLHHWHFNAGKRSVALDLESAGDLEHFLRLAERADAVVETCPPGWLATLGIGYRQLSSRSPGIVMTSITPFGQSGPRASWHGPDIVGAASAGIMAIYGLPGHPPYHPGGEQAFHQAGLAGAVGTLVAFWDRHRTGLGQHVDVSMQEALAIAPEAGLGYADIEGKPRGRRGVVTLDGARTLFQCLDGWVAGVFGGRWAERVDWLQQNGFLSTADAALWRDNDYRLAQGTAMLDQLTLELVARLPKETVYREAQSRRMAISPVQRISDLFRDRQLAARGFFQPIRTPEHGLTPLDSGAPFVLSRSPWRIDRPAPKHNEPQDEVWIEADETSSWPRPAPDSDQNHVACSTAVGPIGNPASRGDGGDGGSPLFGGRAPLPLEGIRVVDFTVQGAGPVATRLLACFGAEVIKVETPSHLDGARVLTHPRPFGNPSPNVNGIFNNFSADKFGISVQIDTERGRKVVRDLIAISDVVVDNFGRDPFPRWGLTVDAMFAIRPDLIVARSSVMGRTGPEREYVGFGYGVSAAAGLTSVTGFPEDPPLGPGALADFTCNPHHLVAGILAALEYRRRSGEGQVVDLSQVESTISFLGPALLDYQLNGRDSRPGQNRSTEMAPHGAYPCQGDDRWCVIAVESDAVWEQLCRLADRPEWLADPRWTTLAGRKEHEDALDAALADWTKELDAFELAELLQAGGVAASAVASTFDLLHGDQHLGARAYYRWIEHPEAGLRAHDGPPFRLSRHTAGPFRPAPCLGEHTDLVLRDHLGLDEDTIGGLYVAGAVG